MNPFPHMNEYACFESLSKLISFLCMYLYYTSTTARTLCDSNYPSSFSSHSPTLR